MMVLFNNYFQGSQSGALIVYYKSTIQYFETFKIRPLHQLQEKFFSLRMVWIDWKFFHFRYCSRSWSSSYESSRCRCCKDIRHDRWCYTFTNVLKYTWSRSSRVGFLFNELQSSILTNKMDDCNLYICKQRHSQTHGLQAKDYSHFYPPIHYIDTSRTLYVSRAPDFQIIQIQILDIDETKNLSMSRHH